MYKTVFILGAGASADAGLPVMANFLDRARDFYSSFVIRNEEDQISFMEVFKAIHNLKGVLFKSSIDLNNIESVFSIIDMGLLLGRLGSFRGNELEQLYENIQKLIAVTVDLSTRVNNRSIPPQKLKGTYYDFIGFLEKHFIEKERNVPYSSPSPPTIITFNYDVALDYALHLNEIPITYCLDPNDIGEGWKLIKLHGSVNWGYTDDEEDGIYAWSIGKFLSSKGIGQADNSPILIGSLLRKEINEEGKAIKGPFIVPPSWSKREFHKKIEPVWEAAADALADAEAIYVIGYSLPPTDIFFRYLFSLATFSEASIRHFWVFNPDPDVKERFEELLGPGLKTDNRFKFFETDFKGAHRILIEELGKPSK